MRKLISTALNTLILSALFAVSANAMTAQEAKAAGLIKEDCAGYVVATKDEGKAVADTINSGRKEEYKRLAAEQKVSDAVIATTAGKKLCGK